MISFSIPNRFTGEAIFTTDIDCSEDALWSVKITIAAKIAIEKKINLQWANLQGSNLQGSNLQEANLQKADLHGANLQGADLRLANLLGANLRGADLRGANLRLANLLGADMRGAIGLDKKPTQTVILPEGDLIVYKQLEEGVAKLLIPADAKRSNATGRKCRAEYAKVLELPEGVAEGTSKHDSKFKYRVGEIVRPDSFDPDWKNECAGGIHFFITRDEAEEY